MPDVPAVRMTGVTKAYGATRAVDGLDLEVADGVFLGLLGPNGAGKSTTMRILTGRSRVDQGTVEVLGLPMPAASRRVRSLLGVVPQQDNLDAELTARQNLEVYARFGGLGGRDAPAAVDRALRRVRLSDRQDSAVGALSGGMRRSLLLARALVVSPRLLLLDEPTVGLDPQVRQHVWDIIDDLRTQGTTVVMSTHYIEEAERLVDEVAVMSAGRLVARGTPKELLQRYAGAQAAEFRVTGERRDRIERLITDHGRTSRRTGSSVSVLRAETMPDELRQALGPADVLRPATLEDVFVSLTGKTFD